MQDTENQSPSPTLSNPSQCPSPNNDRVSEEPILVLVNVKVICAGEKRTEHKTYILRNIDLAKVQDMDSLK